MLGRALLLALCATQATGAEHKLNAYDRHYLAKTKYKVGGAWLAPASASSAPLCSVLIACPMGTALEPRHVAPGRPSGRGVHAAALPTAPPFHDPTAHPLLPIPRFPPDQVGEWVPPAPPSKEASLQGNVPIPSSIGLANNFNFVQGGRSAFKSGSKTRGQAGGMRRLLQAESPMGSKVPHNWFGQGKFQAPIYEIATGIEECNLCKLVRPPVCPCARAAARASALRTRAWCELPLRPGLPPERREATARPRPRRVGQHRASTALASAPPARPRGASPRRTSSCAARSSRTTRTPSTFGARSACYSDCTPNPTSQIPALAHASAHFMASRLPLARHRTLLTPCVPHLAHRCCKPAG